jgi:hypothetical protein
MRKWLANPLTVLIGLLMSLAGVFSISLPGGNIALGLAFLAGGSLLLFLTQRGAAPREG